VAPYLLEEAFEAVEAVESGDAAAAAAELGDALFQVAFLARLYAERGDFGLAQVIAEVEAKMRRRHPHVFGGAKAETSEDVKTIWYRIKSQERGRAETRAPVGLLESVPKSLPGLARAQRLGQRAEWVGFDWPGAAKVWEKVGEETGELSRAANPGEEETKLGELLFTLSQWARHRGIDAEAVLRRANASFSRRFAMMEEMVRERGLVLRGLSAQAWDNLWEEAKAWDRTRVGARDKTTQPDPGEDSGP
jgi:MazG family protein